MSIKEMLNEKLNIQEVTKVDVLGSHGVWVIKYPSNRYGFVGSVPMAIAYQYIDEPNKEIPNDILKRISISSNPAMVTKPLGIKVRGFESEKDAVEFYKNWKKGNVQEESVDIQEASEVGRIIVKTGKKIDGFVWEDKNGECWYAFGKPSQPSYIAWGCKSIEDGKEKIKKMASDAKMIFK